MNRKRSSRLVGIAMLGALVAGGLTCRQSTTPSDLKSYDQNTISYNLQAVQTADSVYMRLAAGGNLSAAAGQAQAMLLKQPGVDTAVIAPDNTVWVFFANGLETGMGEPFWDQDSTGLTAQVPALEPVRAASGAPGGYPFHQATIVEPEFLNSEGLASIAGMIKNRLRSLQGGDSLLDYADTDVTLENIRSIIHDQSPVIYWIGHGTRVATGSGKAKDSTEGLITGERMDGSEMAAALAGRYRQYANPDSGRPKLALPLDVRGRYHMVILPAFIASFGDFRNWPHLWPPANRNQSLVYLSSCYGACQSGPQGKRELLQAFLDAGADLACGYDWAVHGGFVLVKDTSFLNHMSDTLTAAEAVRQMGNLTDPSGVDGRQATFQTLGDTLLMLDPLIMGTVGGQAMIARADVHAETSAENPGCVEVEGMPRANGHPQLDITIIFPPKTGTYDVMQSAAAIHWDEYPWSFTARPGDVGGVSGTVSIDRCDNDFVSGSFSGRLGYWESIPGHYPSVNPPDSWITVTNGRFRYSGPINHL